METTENKSIVLFDGVCILCNSAVSFILKNDTKNHFVFASLQSDAAKEILLQQPSKKNNLDTIILIDNGKIYERSTAAIKIGTKLGWMFKWVYVGYLLPVKVRDALYNWIAKNRYKWFGKRETCFIPTEKEKSKFL